MSDYDVRIHGAKVYTPAGLVEADILIKGEKIAGIVGHDTPGQASKVINAKGKTVFPGIIDMHCHTREPGYTHKEDFYSATQAAAAGGITVIVDQPNVEPPTIKVQDYLDKKALAEEKCIVDFGHILGVTQPDQIEAAAKAGITMFKFFQVKGEYPHDPRLAINDDGEIYKVLKLVADTGLVCVVHPFNQSLFDAMSDEAFAAGDPPDHITFSKIYTRDVIWRTCVSSLINLQGETGARLHFFHTHSHGSLRMIREAKKNGQKVTADCDPKYFHLNKHDLDTKGPMCCPGGFIAEDKERMAEIWRSLEDGTMDCVSSDHAPHTIEEIEKQRENAWIAAMGSPQYDHYMSIFLSDYHKGLISLKTMVRILSEAPAKILGLYPQKGAILPGSDADLVIADMDYEFTVTNENLYTKVGWTPYAGWKMKGKPVLTMLRGTVIMENGVVIGQRGFGRYIAGRPNPVY